MSLKNEKFEGAVKEIVDAKHQEEAAKSRAKTQIKDICERMKEEHDVEPKELKAYADKVYLKEVNRAKYNQEAELNTRIYEEVDNYEI